MHAGRLGFNAAVHRPIHVLPRHVICFLPMISRLLDMADRTAIRVIDLSQPAKEIVGAGRIGPPPQPDEPRQSMP